MRLPKIDFRFLFYTSRNMFLKNTPFLLPIYLKNTEYFINIQTFPHKIHILLNLKFNSNFAKIRTPHYPDLFLINWFGNYFFATWPVYMPSEFFPKLRPHTYIEIEDISNGSVFVVVPHALSTS